MSQRLYSLLHPSSVAHMKSRREKTFQPAWVLGSLGLRVKSATGGWPYSCSSYSSVSAPPSESILSHNGSSRGQRGSHCVYLVLVQSTPYSLTPEGVRTLPLTLYSLAECSYLSPLILLPGRMTGETEGFDTSGNPVRQSRNQLEITQKINGNQL